MNSDNAIPDPEPEPAEKTTEIQTDLDPEDLSQSDFELGDWEENSQSEDELPKIKSNQTLPSTNMIDDPDSFDESIVILIPSDHLIIRYSRTRKNQKKEEETL